MCPCAHPSLIQSHKLWYFGVTLSLSINLVPLQINPTSGCKLRKSMTGHCSFWDASCGVACCCKFETRSSKTRCLGWDRCSESSMLVSKLRYTPVLPDSFRPPHQQRTCPWPYHWFRLQLCLVVLVRIALEHVYVESLCWAPNAANMWSIKSCNVDFLACKFQMVMSPNHCSQ